MEFSNLLVRERKKNYASAKEFYKRNSLSCTYAYYSRIENGVLPDIDLALEIIEKLKINSHSGLSAWVRDQMPNPTLKAMFSDPHEEFAAGGDAPSVNKALLVNRMQAKLLREDPLYYEIILYLVSYFHQKKVSVPEIAKQFGLASSRVKTILRRLHEFGLVEKQDPSIFYTKEWVVIPHDKEFQDLRDLAFRRAYSQFQKVSPDHKWHSTFTKLLRPSDLKIIEAKVTSLTHTIMELPQIGGDKDARPYTFGFFSSPRRFGTTSSAEGVKIRESDTRQKYGKLIRD